MLIEAEKGAQLERDSHAYENRTGALEASTRAEGFPSNPNETRVDLVMGGGNVDYAEIIVEEGFSDFEDIAEDVGDHIMSIFNA